MDFKILSRFSAFIFFTGLITFPLLSFSESRLPDSDEEQEQEQEQDEEQEQDQEHLIPFPSHSRHSQYLSVDDPIPFAERSFNPNTCTEEQEEKIMDLEYLAQRQIGLLQLSIKSTLENGDRSEWQHDTEKRLQLAYKVIFCSKLFLKQVAYDCKQTGPCLTNPTSMAWTKIRSRQPVTLCDRFWKRSRWSWHYQPIHQASILVHEATHKCGTNDADYFHYTAPSDQKGRPWHSIASTYEYWILNGLCIPDVNC